MKKFLPFLLLFVLGYGIAKAQFTGVDASGYPIVKAYGSGPMFNNAKLQDFVVQENGIDMKSTLKVNCTTVPDDPSLSAVLVIDISTSMDEPVGGGKKRLDWVKEGAKTFINNLVFNANTYIAIITFNGDSYLKIGFQNDKDVLIQAIDNISTATGSTQYDPPFLKGAIGAIDLLNTRPSWIKKTIIFLTDGNPNSKPSTQTIINKLVTFKIKTYAICMSNDASTDLREIAQKSGGQLYVSLTLDALNYIYSSLATSSRQTVTYCWLEWISPPGCTEASRTRNVFLRHKPSNTIYNDVYIAPPSSVSGIINSVVSLPPFPDIPAGNSLQETYTITAQNGDMNVTGHSFIPSSQGNFSIIDWGGTPPPFTLAKGTSRTITVQFTQTSPRDARSAQLLISGTPCSAPIVLLSGGIKKITLLTPNGGEAFSTCDSLFISWTGVEETDTVKLEYSMDIGATWQLVTPFATHNYYNWKPPQPNTYMIRVSPYSPKPIGPAWTRSGGGLAGDSSTAVTVTSDGSTLYLTGDFNKQATFDGKVIVSSKTQEAFLARYNNEKLIWAVSGATFLAPLAPYLFSGGKGVAIDSADISCYVLGEVMPTSTNFYQLYVAKIDPTGKQTWLTTINSTNNVRALRIARDSATKKMYIEGTYQGIMSIRLESGITAKLESPNVVKTFLAFVNQNGNITSLQDSTYQLPFNQRVAKDSIGNTYETSTYGGNFTSGDTTIRSVGAKDFYVRRIGRILSLGDVSDSYCTISDPYFGFAYQPNTVGTGQIGDFHDTTFKAILCNKGQIPITFTDYKFEGNFPNDFSLTSALKGVTIPKDSCIALTIRFTPSATSYLSSVLRVFTECSEQQIIFTGFGIDRQAKIDSLNWYRKRKLTDNLDTMWIRNTGTTDLKINKISLEVQPENSFVPIFPTVPLTIKVKDSIWFLVLFNPQDTLSYHNSVQVEVEGFSKPLVGTLDGQGVLPDVRGIGYDFKPTYLNTLSPEIGKLTMYNPSTTSETAIKGVRFISIAGDNTGDFAWATPPSANFIIQDNTSDIQTYDIRFTANAVGKRIAHIEIMSDAVPGPDITIPRYDTVEITGFGFFTPLQVDSVIDFERVLTCESAVDSITITNIDPANDVKITNIEFNGDGSIFTYSPADFLVVPAGGSRSIQVIFSPSESKLYSATITLTTEANQVFTIRISGSGYTVAGNVQLLADNTTFNPGERISVTVIANVENLNNTNLDSLRFKITVPPQVLNIVKVNPIMPGWNWSIDNAEQNKGVFNILGIATQSIHELQSQKLFSLDLNTYLEKQGTYPIIINIESPLKCLTLSAQGTTVEMLLGCFNNGRVVAMTGNMYSLSEPYPNPVSDDIFFDVSVGLTGKATFSMINQLGEVIKTIEIPSLGAGEHKITIPVGDLSGGIYSVKFTSGQFSTVRKSIITR
ncbi:MAG: choice-of-anchor D domain-containing protein [Ignavibacteriae bacterium]|nr:choice-of-anchor D domain-containing protein [Ignavibacteriota bacterium]